VVKSEKEQTKHQAEYRQLLANNKLVHERNIGSSNPYLARPKNLSNTLGWKLRLVFLPLFSPVYLLG